MKPRKLLSAVLAICMVLSGLPGTGILDVLAFSPVSKGGSNFTYTRLAPEVALMNAYTGNDTQFYTSVQKDSRYNFASQVSGLDKKISSDCTVTYSNFGSTVINEIAKNIYRDVEASYSATFYNNNSHSHYAGFITIDTSYIGSTFNINGSRISTPSGWNGISSKTTRQGNMKFGTVNGSYSSNSEIKLVYTNSIRYYEGITGKNYTCTCGGDAYDHTIVFRDAGTPKLYRPTVKNKATGAESSNFKGGDTILLTVTSSEPLRFASDAVPSKDIVVGLKVDGEGKDKELIATLTSLVSVDNGASYTTSSKKYEYDNSMLTFECKVPDGINVKIIGIDLEPTQIGSNQAALCSSKNDIPLRQVKGSDSFDISSIKRDSKSALGFTQTSSYITDIAGNAISSSDLTCSFYVDSEKPYVAQADVIAATNNAKVKEALGKNDMSPDDPLYIDGSDRYLSAYDQLMFQIYMNEVTSPNIGVTATQKYETLNIKTNILDSSSNNVSFSSIYVYKCLAPSSELGKAASEGRVSCFITPYVAIQPGWHIDGDDKTIRIIDYSFGDTPVDASNNVYDGTRDVTTTSQSYMLDMELPEIISTGKATSVPAYGQGGFYVSFTIKDNIPDSVAALSANLVWEVNNGMKRYKYQYAISSSSAAPAESAWKDGRNGDNHFFTQTGGEQFFHVRPVEGEGYDISTSRIIFNVCDYAGNSGGVPLTLTNINIDRKAPSIKENSVSKDIITPDGKLTVNVEIDDNSGHLNSPAPQPQYAWSSSPVAIEDNAVWTDMIGSLDGNNTIFSVTADVANGTIFDSYLWVKAEDNSGNKSGPKYVGHYNFNLSGVNYTMKYTTDITSRARISNISFSTADSSLFFVIPTGENNEYLYCRINGGYTQNIFDASIWRKCTLQLGETSAVITDLGGENTAFPWLGSNSSAETLPVTVLSTLNEFVSDSSSAVTLSSMRSESFTLYVAKLGSVGTSNFYPEGVYIPGGNDGIGNAISIKLSLPGVEDPLKGYGYHAWYEDLGFSMASIEGLAVKIQISFADGCEWLADDIDYENSFLHIQPWNTDEVFRIPINSGLTQIVTLPDLDIGGGKVVIIPMIARKSGEHPTQFSDAAEFIYADNTQPVSSQAVKTIHYLDTNSPSDIYGLSKRAYTQEIIPNAVPYMPTTTGSAVSADFINTLPFYSVGDYASCVELAFDESITGVIDQPYGDYGFAVIKAKNLTTGGEHTNDSNDRYLRLTACDTAEEAAKVTWCLGVAAGTVNTIAVYLQYSNGRTSETTYYLIYPDTESPSETTTVTPSIDYPRGTYLYGEEPYYTIEIGKEEKDRTVIANERLNEGGYRQQVVEPEADGTYKYYTSEDVWETYFLELDQYGVYAYLGGGSVLKKDADAPVVECKSFTEDYSTGIYTAKFTITDDSFGNTAYENPYGYRAVALPVDLHLNYDDDYNELLGLQPGDGMDLTLDCSLEGNNNGKVYWYGEWNAEDYNSLGITRIYGVIDRLNYAIDLEITGVVSPRLEDQGPILLSLSATDYFGHEGSAYEAELPKAQGVMPHVTDYKFDSKYWYQGGVGSTDQALYLSFNVPVRPAESWINRNISGLDYTWIDSFPITADGTWTIDFSDIFGNIYTQEVTIDPGTFGTYGFDLNISTLEPTSEDVIISAATDNGDDAFVTGIVTGKRYDEEAYSYSGIADIHNFITASKDDGYVMIHLPAQYAGTGFDSDARFNEDIMIRYADCTFIYLNNVAKSAPEAELQFFLEEYSDSFTVDELSEITPLTTEQYVKVSYETSRHVTPTSDAEHIFSYVPGQSSYSYTFTYTDDFGNTASKTVTLSDYGITLAAPPEPYRDTEKPIVSVDIFAKKSGAYVKKEFFNVSDEASNTAANVAQAFGGVSYVQDYNLTLNITDYSAYKILLLASEPTSLSYNSSSTFSNSSVILKGNTVQITKDYRTGGADFWVAVVDNAKAGTGAAADNFAVFKVTKSQLDPWFDNVAPVISVTADDEVVNTLYKHTVYLPITDVDDSGQSTLAAGITANGSTLIANTAETGTYNKTKYPYYIEFNSNSEVPVTVMDAAGNILIKTVAPLSFIDDKEPVLTVTWSPGLITADGIDQYQPTLGPVNTDVTAHIYSDKPIDLANTAVEYDDWYNGSGYIALPQDGSYYGISWDATSQRITVNYTSDDSYDEDIRLTVYAPNGKYTYAYLALGEVIDKAEPGISGYDADYLYRSEYASSPYAVEYTYWFDEMVHVAGEGDQLFGGSTPYKFTVYGQDSRALDITDLAGNSSHYTVSNAGLPDDVDNIPPVITFVDPADGDLSKLNASNSTVSIKIKIDENCYLVYDDGSGETEKYIYAGVNTVTFSTNGTKLMSFYDDADNRTDVTVTVNSLDVIPPMIDFSSSTVAIRQGSTQTELKALLDSGVTVSDNDSGAAPTLSFDSSAVKLNTVGIYTVTYTAVDRSGNKGTAQRFVRVVSKDMPTVTIDGKLVDTGGTFSLRPGTHKLTVSNLREDGEPYKVVIAKGIYYDGQLKYLNTQIPVGADGSFTVSGEGFYTFYIQTQSRQSFRCLLDVEQ